MSIFINDVIMHTDNLPVASSPSVICMAIHEIIRVPKTTKQAIIPPLEYELAGPS